MHLHTWGAVQDGPHPLLAHEYATTELFHAPPMITRSQDRTVGLTWGLPRGLLAPAAPPPSYYRSVTLPSPRLLEMWLAAPLLCTLRQLELCPSHLSQCSFLNHAEKFLYHPKGALFCGSAPSTETEIGARAGPWVLESI